MPSQEVGMDESSGRHEQVILSLTSPDLLLRLQMPLDVALAGTIASGRESWKETWHSNEACDMFCNIVWQICWENMHDAKPL